VSGAREGRRITFALENCIPALVLADNERAPERRHDATFAQRDCADTGHARAPLLRIEL
jgi:hypothetical protein